MKLYWGPHTCAIGIHILLEEIGKPYDTEKLDVKGGDTEKPPFRQINRKGKVPTILRDDGSVLTEFGAIATWLARTNPDAKLLPDGIEEQVRATEVLDYAVGTIHAQGFGRVFKPARFEPQDVVHGTLGLGQGSVKEQGRKMVQEGFEILDRHMEGREWAAGGRFSVADAALFYVEHWAKEADLKLPPNLAAHLARMQQRPSVRAALKAEGEPTS